MLLVRVLILWRIIMYRYLILLIERKTLGQGPPELVVVDVN